MPIKEQSYKVADHVFSIRMDKDDALWSDLDNYSPFLYNGGEESVFTLELFQDLSVEGKRALYISNPESLERRVDLYQVDDGYLFEMAPLGNVPVCGWLKTSSDFSKAYLKVEKAKKYCVNNALMLLYAFRTAGMSTLEMHASVTVKDGKGFLFLGQSGTGKSTHSSLWLKNIPGTHLLNDDNPVVRVFDDGHVTVYGSPWSGKTPCYRNLSYPLGGIVLLSQAPYNRIHRLSGIQAYVALVPSISGKRWDKQIADGLHQTEDALAKTVPTWHLECLPDEAAAQLCCKTISGES